MSEWLERIDAELAENDAEREANLADPSIRVLVDLHRLPEAALDWPGRSKQAA